MGAPARKIAAKLKEFERGELPAGQFTKALAEARARDSFRAAIVMDDKIVTIEMPWSTVCSTDEAGLAEYILNQMRETAPAVN